LSQTSATMMATFKRQPEQNHQKSGTPMTCAATIAP
jgi:hypothetical protein